MSVTIAIGPLRAQPVPVSPASCPSTSGELQVRRDRPRSRPGPRVSVTAGIHGAEYVSIAALREVVMGLDPAAVTGSLVAVLTANPAAFAARTIYVNPSTG